MLSHPLNHVHAQQHHVEQLSLLSQQILQDANNIISYNRGDQDFTISRLYQLQSAIVIHDWLDQEFQKNLLDDLDIVIDGVCAVEYCEENVYDIRNQPQQNEIVRFDVGVIMDGTGPS